MVLCLDSSPAYDLGWCPLPSHDLVLIILLLRICSCLMFFFFFDSSMITNDNRSWDCLVELLKTKLLLYMLFLIHRTWYLMNMISPILFVVYLILLLSKLLKIHACILPVKMPHPILRIELEETSCWSFDWANSELIAIGTTNGTP